MVRKVILVCVKMTWCSAMHGKPVWIQRSALTTIIPPSTSSDGSTSSYGSTATDGSTSSYGSTVTDGSTVPSTYGSYCEELCITNNVENDLIGEDCADMYCFCADYGQAEMPCGYGLGWCQEMSECIQDCGESCGGGNSTTSSPDTLDCPTLCHGLGDTAISNSCCS